MVEQTEGVIREVAAGFAAAQVILKARKARPFFGRHPWVLDSAIDSIDGDVADGDVVDLVTDAGKFIARGFYNSHSRIRVRLYTWNAPEALDETLLASRLRQAIELRERLEYNDPEGAARLVFSEADGLSGLIVDRYRDYLAVQASALGIAMRLDVIVPLLVELVHPKAIILRTEKGVIQAEGIEHREGALWGEMPDGPVFIQESGLKFGVDLAVGQKTGFYLDQRENRLAAARYARGRRVLDMFCYSGGFSLMAATHGHAKEVVPFDSSQKAVLLARANAELNSVHQARFETSDAFDALDHLSADGERFGMVVLDPPKFARSRQAIDEAMRAYHRLNRLAVDLLEPGGTLVTCSCSGHVSREDFVHMLSGVAQQSRRDIQILEARGAAPDHPVSATCLENEYLKCFICRVR